MTIAEFERFVDDDGYEDPRFWTPADWAWLESGGGHLPKDWIVRNGRRYVRTMFDRLPLDEVNGWPVGVSPAEARAYARWSGARLPEHEELTLAAAELLASAKQGLEHRGNFDFRHGSPTPVGSFPEGATTTGVHDLLGNGWDLTCNGSATLLFGGSWATHASLLCSVPEHEHGEAHPAAFTQFRLARDTR